MLTPPSSMATIHTHLCGIARLHYDVEYTLTSNNNRNRDPNLEEEARSRPSANAFETISN